MLDVFLKSLLLRALPSRLQLSINSFPRISIRPTPREIFSFTLDLSSLLEGQGKNMSAADKPLPPTWLRNGTRIPLYDMDEVNVYSQELIVLWRREEDPNLPKVRLRIEEYVSRCNKHDIRRLHRELLPQRKRLKEEAEVLHAAVEHEHAPMSSCQRCENGLCWKCKTYPEKTKIVRERLVECEEKINEMEKIMKEIWLVLGSKEKLKSFMGES